MPLRCYLAILLTGLLCLASPDNCAQTPPLDSLNRLIRQAPTDTGRVMLMVRKINLLSKSNLDTSIAYGQATLRQARQLAFPKGEITAAIKLATSYFFKGDFAAGQRHLLIAERLLRTNDLPIQRADLYASYGMQHGMQSHYDSAIAYFKQAIRVVEPLQHPVLPTYYQNLSISYQMLSNYRQALAYQQKALTIYQKKADSDGQAYSLMNMGITYNALGDDGRAERSFFDAIKQANRASNQQVALYAYSNLASLYEKQAKPPKAYKYALKAVVLGRQAGDDGMVAASLAKAAVAAMQMHQNHRADSLAGQSLTIARRANQPLITYQVNAAQATILKLQGRCAEAIPYFRTGFAALTHSDIYEMQVGDSYRDLSACYRQTGDYRNALTTYQTAAAISDSVRSRENIRKATELTLTAEFDRQREVAQAERQKEQAVASIRQVALLGGLLLTLLIAAIALIAYRTKQRANGLLERQKEALQQALTQLQIAQKQLIHKEKMASLGELTAGIAHEIQNPLNFVNNFAEISSELVTELTDERQKPTRDPDLENDLLTDLDDNLVKIKRHGQRAAAIVRGMLAHSRNTGGTPQPTALNTLVGEYLKLAYQGERAKDKSLIVDLVTDFDPAVGKVMVVPEDIGRVLLNGYTNAFYAVRQKQKALPRVPAADEQTGGEPAYLPQVTVQTVRRNDGLVEIMIRDNGTGIPAGIQPKVFQPFFTTKPTGEGTGLGLSLSYDIITQGHNGTLSVDSQEGEYTCLLIQLPA